jgi:hypothetical protein
MVYNETTTSQGIFVSENEGSNLYPLLAVNFQRHLNCKEKVDQTIRRFLFPRKLC